VRIVREVTLSDHPVSSYVIIKALDGDLLVAGATSSADSAGWAIRLDSEGRRLWQFVDGSSEDFKEPPGHHTGRFNGGVFLEGGRTLLCGTLATPEEPSSGHVVILASDGKLSSSKSVWPKIDGAISAEIKKCLPWRDGIALIGRSDLGIGGKGWLVRLDNSGTQSYEVEIPCVEAFDAVETPDHELALSCLDNTERIGDSSIVRLGNGKATSTRHIPGHALFVRSSTNGDFLGVVAEDVDRKSSLYRLDEHLQDISKPVSVGEFQTKQSYTLADGSAVLFGSVYERGATAAVGRFYSHAFRPFALKPLNSSGGFIDAVATDRPNEFATVRTMLADGRAVLAWVAIEK
jgi:hypothetical protein